MTNAEAERDDTIAAPSNSTSMSDGRPAVRVSSPKERVGSVVAGSFLAGILASGLLVAATIIPPMESSVTGAILLGLALGWAMLAALSVRYTRQPQRWAVAPAIFMGLGGSLLLAFGSHMLEAMAWVWPPAMLVLAVWMVVQARRHLRSRSGRLLLYPVIALLVLASLGSGFETARGALAAGAHPAQGQLIDVGGHRLYLNCIGSGSPTVVLEPGAGMMSSDLAYVKTPVAQKTRVCAYDRAGRGWSDSATTTQDAVQTATDLHTLLKRAGEPGPYVLAGHSFGGLYALTFAASYPDDVAGMVLVDSTAPATEPQQGSTESTPTDSEDTVRRVSALGALAARLGIGRLLGVETSSHLRGTIDEYLQAGSSAQAAAALSDFSDKPLAVLTSSTGNQPGWDASQDALATLSTNSLHRVIDGSTHASLITDHEDAAATALGILELVSAVRTASPLVR